MKAHIRLWPRSTYSLADNRTLIQYLPGYVSERRGFCGRFWKRQHGPVLKIELYLRLLLPMEEIVVGACRSRAYHRQKAKELQDPFHSSTASSASSSSSSRVSRMQVFMSLNTNPTPLSFFPVARVPMFCPSGSRTRNMHP